VGADTTGRCPRQACRACPDPAAYAGSL